MNQIINNEGQLDIVSLDNLLTSNLTHNIAITFIIFVILFTISIILKGYSMWYSARNNQKWWFISLLTINTLGILEIIYLLFYRDKKVIEAMSSTSQKEVDTNNHKNMELEIAPEIHPVEIKEGDNK